jgi:transcription initiation factor TFIIIB Brf1 subunit/transcription initiation factor TFIIB
MFSGCSPTGIAGGAIYIASQVTEQSDGIYQDTISDALNTTTVTIRNRYKDILNYFGDEKTLLEKYQESN